MNICITSIVSKNYLAYAKVLAQSVVRHAPQCSFVVLLVDRKTDEGRQVAKDLPFPVIWAEELGLTDFDQIAYKFDILELNTALKPTLLKKLLGKGYESVIYLDPDISLFSAPTPVLEALQQFSIVLTPHTTAPIMDGQKPSDVEIMRSGVYNLGFVAVRKGEESLRMLDWWEARCLSAGFNDQQSGIFVDQKWMDLTPAYFNSVCLLKDPGCNVAYWNLHERALSRNSEGVVLARDVPLVFFHFSGVDAKKPGRLSKHQNRHDLPVGSVLRSLVEQYIAALLRAGHAEYLGIPYTFSKLTNGTPITAVMRRAILVYRVEEKRPFDAQSPFQRSLAKLGLSAGAKGAGSQSRFSKVTSMNFDANDPAVRMVNTALRAAARLFGLDRLQLLLRYFALLGRGSNLAAVLTRSAFQLEAHLTHKAPTPLLTAEAKVDERL